MIFELTEESEYKQAKVCKSYHFRDESYHTKDYQFFQGSCMVK